MTDQRYATMTDAEVLDSIALGCSLREELLLQRISGADVVDALAALDARIDSMVTEAALRYYSVTPARAAGEQVH